MISIFGKTPATLGIIHFVGIGGVGMSALAEMLHDLGYHVQGSDISENINVKRLKAKGIDIFIGHVRTNIDRAFRIVISSAIKEDNPEICAAKELGVRSIHRGELLAEVCRHFRTIAVVGTHGKTTTSALIYTLLDAAGLGAGVLNGGLIYSIRSNTKIPSKAGGYLVVESDESDGSFLKLQPHVAALTNIEEEHMDYYGDMETLNRDFSMFAARVQEYISICADHKGFEGISDVLRTKDVIRTGVLESNDVRAVRIRYKGAASVFDIEYGSEKINDVVLYMPGEHNITNALLAVSVALREGVSLQDIKKGLAAFKGVGRRFIRVGHLGEAVVIDDYAHHPSEVASTLKGAKQAFDGKIVAVFQPHRYTRLRDHMDAFATCFKDADEIIIAPVYAAGEQPIVNVDSHILVQRLKKNFGRKSISLAQTAEEASLLIEDVKKRGDVVLCMGAGNINQWAMYFAQKGA